MGKHTAVATASAPVARRLLGTAAVMIIAVAVALVGVGSSYALWSSRTEVNASTVTAGTTGLTVNDSTALVLSGLDATKLGPGQSAVVGVIVKNTGSTKLNVTVDRVAVTGTNALPDELTLTVTPVNSPSACVAGMAGGATDRLANFSTVATPMTFPAGASAAVCLELKVDTDAPISVQKGTAAFTLNLAGVQVR